jgi:NAD(P)-dependent dehydrogenase (short-subunit alcohol dehydrogenase family)
MTTASLAGRYILVLGGSDGMGYATAAHLVRSGSNVTITGRTVDKLESAQRRLIEQDAVRAEQVRIEAGDARDPKAVEAAVSTATGPGGELDGIFVVAGLGVYRPMLETGIAFADEMWAINMYPLINAIQCGAPVMIRHGGGSIVALSSVAAAVSAPGMAAYGAAKAAVDHYVRCAADELGKHRVRVNAVRSGYTKTTMTAGVLDDEEWNARFIAATPLGEPYGRAEDFGPMVSLLLSGDARWITGQVFAIDGGMGLRGYAGKNLDPTDKMLSGM